MAYAPAMKSILAAVSALALLAVPALAQDLPPGPDLSDTPAVAPPETPPNADYVKREAMIPMRDGVKLYTVLVIPKGAHNAPMLLTRTPYDAFNRVRRNVSPSRVANLSQSDELFTADGYIRVFQDIRGAHRSQGAYVMTRPPRGPLNPTATDDTTDAWDTIDWLVKNTPESNGKVGMIGSSYEGWTVVLALLDPHPALKVAAPESPMVDGWMGDDWFHYGAFRQSSLDFFVGQTADHGEGPKIARETTDDYEGYRRAGSIDDWARAHGLGDDPFMKRVEAHAAYDGFWQGQALDKLLAAHPSHVPTMWEQGLWDQEDMWGAIHSWTALTKAGYGDTNYLVMGPWRHSGANYDGSTLGVLHFNGDTALQWRRDVLKPFFDQYLKDGAPKADTPRVFIYDTGLNQWDRLSSWPDACEAGCAAPMKPLYLEAGFGLGFDKPAGAAADSYVSDPAKPAPYLVPPVVASDGERWKSWLTTDQRPAAARPDVLVYETGPLDKPVRIAGAPVADIWAATTGTDADFVVKLIDVYPDLVPSRPELSGYQLPIAMDIFRGRYRDSFEHPSAVPAGKLQRYRFALPTANHVFLPGHRIMVQIQSSWFPLYDRNPQTYVDNIFLAKPEDYKTATIRISHAADHPSAVWLPVSEGR